MRILPPHGSKNPIYMFIDYSPRAEALRHGQLFKDAGGEQLLEYMDTAKIDPADCYFTAFYKRDLEGGDPSEKELEISKNFLSQEIAERKPKLIFTLGGNTFKALMGKKLTKTYRPGVNIKVGEETYRLLPLISPWAVFHGGRKFEGDIIGTLINERSKIHPDPKVPLDYRYLDTIPKIKKYIDLLLQMHELGMVDEYIAVDLETNMFDQYQKDSKVIMVIITHRAGQSYSIPFEHPESPFNNFIDLKEVKKQFSRLIDAGIPIAGHNFKFDYQWIRVYFGCKEINCVADSMIASYVLKNKSSYHGLDTLIPTVLGKASHKKKINDFLKKIPKKAERSYSKVPMSLLLEYAYEDSDMTFQLAKKLEGRLRKSDLYDFYHDIMIPANFFCSEMEFGGAYVNQELMGEVKIFYEEFLEESRKKIFDCAYIQAAVKIKKKGSTKLTAWQFLEIVLYDESAMGLPRYPSKKKRNRRSIHDEEEDEMRGGTGKLTVNQLIEDINEAIHTKGTKRLRDKRKGVDVFYSKGKLEKIKPVLEEIIIWKKNQKLYTSYVKKMPDLVSPVDGCIHPEFRLTSVATGRTSCVKPPFQTFPYKCLHGGIKISLLNGTEVAIKDLPIDKDFYVYGCKESGEIIVQRARSLGVTRREEELCIVELDNGEEIKCSLDHRFFMRDGSYSEASELKEGDSLMPLYRKTNDKGYEEFQHNHNTRKEWYKTHQLSAKYYYGDRPYRRKKGEEVFVMHHVDFDKRNNSPENILRMSHSAHQRIHQEVLEEWVRSPEGKAVLSKKSKERWKDPVARRRMIDAQKETINDPGYKRRFKQKLRDSKKFVDTHRKHMHSLWEDPAFRKRRIDDLQRFNQREKTQEEKAFRSEVSRRSIMKLNSDPTFCKNRNRRASLSRRAYNQWKRLKLGEKITLQDFRRHWLVQDRILTDAEAREFAGIRNHRVVSVKVKKYKKKIPLYDIAVETTENFALTSGVFVHNSRAKDIFVSRHEKGFIMSVDYSQMELRVAAMMSGDEAMIQAFLDDKDIHRAITADIMKMDFHEVPDHLRRHFKTIIFGILYGRGAKAIAAALGIPIEEAQEYINKFYDIRKQLFEFIRTVQRTMKAGENYIRTPFGRRIMIYERGNYEEHKVNRFCINYPIQGHASDFGLAAGSRVMREMKDLRLKTTIYNFVHDSLMFDLHPEEVEIIWDLCQKHMVQYPAENYDFMNGVPLKAEAEIGLTWGHFVDIEFNEKGILLEGNPRFMDEVVTQMGVLGSEILNVDSLGLKEGEMKLQYLFDRPSIGEARSTA